MRLQLVTAFVALSLLACGRSQNSGGYASNSGAVALSKDDALVYAVDSDNGTLEIVDAQKREKIAETKVGRNPEHVLVGPDDTVYISNRGSRSVSVVRRGQWDAPVATIDVGVEPYAMALTDDGKTLLVVNSTMLTDSDHGSLMGIDTKSLQPTFEVPVGQEPRGVAVVDGNAALVSLSKTGDVVRVNLDTHAVNGTMTAKQLNAEVNATNLDKNAFNGPTPMPDMPGNTTMTARSALELASTPDGKRAVATTVWSSNATIEAQTTDTSTSTGGAAYGSPTPCSSGSVASAGTYTIDTHTLAPIVDSIGGCSASTGADFAPTVMHANGDVVQGPNGIVIDPTGQWLFVVNKQSDNIAVMPANARVGDNFATNLTQTVSVPEGPVGIAITHDGKHAWVYSLFAHSLVSIEGKADAADPVLVPSKPIVLAADTLDAETVAGRKLFFSAIDHRMNSIGIACATCHTDGREDGHVWEFSNGPRQTPSLAGRMVSQTAPYHWTGEFPTFADFASHTITTRMGGTGLDSIGDQQVLKFIDSMDPPDNPNKLAQPTPEQLRGAQVFQKAQCNTCHGGAVFTDNRDVDVGTSVTVAGLTPTDFIPNGLNTPSLLGLARTAPYLHTGAAATLEERIRMNQSANLHGQTSDLTDGEISDLVAYLKSL